MNLAAKTISSIKSIFSFSKGKTEIYIHIACWTLVLITPILLFDHNTSTFKLHMLTRQFVWQSVLMIVFYVNYLLLVPRILQKGRQWVFLLLNALLIAACCSFMNYRTDRHREWMEKNRRIENRNNPSKMKNGGTTAQLHSPNHQPRNGRRQFGPPIEFIKIQNLFTLILVVGLGAAIRMTQDWRKVENARKEAELGLAEAELKNLRSQINPHFLLNTLNNIYALIEFDATKAQAAVHDLSKLLRHALYDNQQSFVPLTKEIDFLKGYIELMRIRMASHVSLNIEFDVKEESTTLIAPLIFISLIENAFKHGISPTEPSHIDISIKESGGQIACRIANSNFPKDKNDKSGSGIGLQQVQKRLDLMYKGNYTWEKGTSSDGREYVSSLTINSKQEMP